MSAVCGQAGLGCEGKIMLADNAGLSLA
jgi:hypothetical protein